MNNHFAVPLPLFSLIPLTPAPRIDPFPPHYEFCPNELDLKEQRPAALSLPLQEVHAREGANLWANFVNLVLHRVGNLTLLPPASPQGEGRGRGGREARRALLSHSFSFVLSLSRSLLFVLLSKICNKSLESRSGGAACNDFQLPRRKTRPPRHRRCRCRRTRRGMLAHIL